MGKFQSLDIDVYKDDLTIIELARKPVVGNPSGRTPFVQSLDHLCVVMKVLFHAHVTCLLHCGVPCQ